MKRYLARLLLALPFLAMAPALAHSRAETGVAAAGSPAKASAAEPDRCRPHTFFATAADLARGDGSFPRAD
jgi:hypothetical protein